MGRKFSHLTFTDRVQIEAYLKIGMPKTQIAELTKVNLSTIYREIKRGQYRHLNTDWTTEVRYSSDIAHKQYKIYLSEKGPNLKIGNDLNFANYIENKILKDDYSPAAVLGEIKVKNMQFNTKICKSTFYSYIDKGIFLTLTNKDLPAKGRVKQKYKKIRRIKRAPSGTSIEKRPKEADDKKTFGHWEMDTVYGEKEKSLDTLLVLSERLTRSVKIFHMKDRTAKSVVKTIDALERKYGKRFSQIFQTITVDNGSEFADVDGIENSIKRGQKRTKMYFCHPYSSWERGLNENHNKMIRRKIPKGTDLRKITKKKVAEIEGWMNGYPRKILEFRSAYSLFEKQLAAIS